MSEPTPEPVDFRSIVGATVRTAVEEALVKAGGGIITGYAVAVDFIDSDGVAGWALLTAEHMNIPAQLGILRFHTLAIEETARAYLAGAIHQDPQP